MPNLCKPYPLQTSECGQQPHSPLESIAGPQVLLGIAPDDSDPTEDEILEQYDWYIRFLAWHIVNRNGKIVHLALLDLMVDDLIQNSRIKFWWALKKGVPIHNIKALLRQIVHNEFINMVRQHKPALSLPLDDDGELRQGKPITAQSEDLDDPEHIVEQQMAVVELLHIAAAGVATMHHRQRQAMICSLREAIEDAPQLVAIFREHEIEIETLEWPAEKDQKALLKASVSPARRKMRSLQLESICA
jgi:DNA-directed RNA polymerase specialized sigma24 family protein